MRNLRAILVGSIVLAACSDRQTGPITSPTGETPGPLVTAPVSSDYCTAKTDTQILLAIEDLYFKNQWPDPNSAKAKFNQVLAALDAQPADIDGARLATKNLVAFITNKFGNLTASQQEAALDAYNTLIADLWCFVGISGQVFDLNPGDPPKTFKLPGVGGVWFPGDVVPTGTLVALTNISDGPAPLNTILDQFASYIDIQLYPAHTFSPPNLPVVVICPEDGTPEDVVLGHNSPLNGFELLDPNVAIPPELAGVCDETTGQNGANQGWLAHWANRAASLLLPQRLQASMLFSGGIGGSPLDFSPFGAVSTTLSGTDGLGGSATEFAPRAQPGAAATSPADGILDGVVGSDGDPQDGDWPVVTVKTLGGDADGQNPIPGVTVTFTIGAASTYNPDSEAQICDENGTVQASVSVLTDANGVASLPCLKFGTKAGYANLQATFDGSSVGFPGDDLLTVTATVGTETSSSLNWLVQSTVGPAAKIVTYMGAAPVASSSYDYGSAFAEGAAVSPPPQVLVTDQYDNPVGSGVGIEWSPLSDANGAILVPGTAATDAQGVATATSWTLGAGAHTLTAQIVGATEPRETATFTASTPTGVSVFACAVGGNKTDIGWMSIPRPNGSVREITLYMSVTGQASSEATYLQSFEVRRNSSTGLLLGGGSGGIQLPGNNGSPRAVTLRLSDPVLTSEYGNGNTTSTLWINLTFSNLPETRKIQVWYNNSITRQNQGPCYNSLVYNPGSTSVFKRGLGINVTN